MQHPTPRIPNSSFATSWKYSHFLAIFVRHFTWSSSLV